MKLIVISPDSEDRREISAVQGMLALGLGRYQVRKPAWTTERLRDWLLAFSADERARMIVHGHPELVPAYGLAGVHWRDDRSVPTYPDSAYGVQSRACHDLEQLRSALGIYGAVTLSPLFPSVSKPGYGLSRAWTNPEISQLLAQRNPAERLTEVYALGGIEVSTLDAVAPLGFDGVAVLGAIWKAQDPVGAFSEIRSALELSAAPFGRESTAV